MTEKMKEIKKGKIETEGEKQELLIQVKEELDREKAREHSINEGKYTAISQGVGHSYISPFVIALGASNAEIGLLSSLPWIISPLAQLKGAKLIEKEKRKSVIIKYVSIKSIMWFTLFLTAIFSYFYIPSELPLITITLYLLLVFVGALAIPGWFSWMGDIIPAESRGRYFSKRNRVVGMTSLTSMLISSFLLDYFKTKGLVFVGFAILFFTATMARAYSVHLFKKQYEPKIKFTKGYYFSFFSFLKRIHKDNFGRFTLFIASMKLAVFIASPFFAVYMLRDLGLSYIWFTLITISTIIFTLLSYNLWGRFSDKYGNKELLKIGSVLIPLAPILWTFSANPYYLIFVPQLIAGIGWAAFTLGANNFIYDISTPERRAITLAYHNLVLGMGVLIGGFIGSILAQYLPEMAINKFLFIFLISGIARITAMGIMLPKINEPRKVKKIKGSEVKAILNEMKPLHIGGLTHYLPHMNNHPHTKEKTDKKLT